MKYCFRQYSYLEIHDPGVILKVCGYMELVLVSITVGLFLWHSFADHPFLLSFYLRNPLVNLHVFSKYRTRPSFCMVYIDIVKCQKLLLLVQVKKRDRCLKISKQTRDWPTSWPGSLHIYNPTCHWIWDDSVVILIATDWNCTSTTAKIFWNFLSAGLWVLMIRDPQNWVSYTYGKLNCIFTRASIQICDILHVHNLHLSALFFPLWPDVERVICAL